MATAEDLDRFLEGLDTEVRRKHAEKHKRQPGTSVFITVRGRQFLCRACRSGKFLTIDEARFKCAACGKKYTVQNGCPQWVK